MPAARASSKSDSTTATAPIHLVAGSDEFSIKEHALELSRKLTPKGGGDMAVEIVEGDAQNQDQAMQVFAKLTEALTMVGLFGGDKLVWWKNTNLLGDNVTTRSEAVKDRLADLTELLKRGLSPGVTLLISAIGCDKRRAAYKFLEKQAQTKIFDAPDLSKSAGAEEVAAFVLQRVKELGKKMSDRTLAVFRDLVAPDFREIANELEKAALYVGDRPEITEDDVRAICSSSRQAVIWELTDAVGERNIGKAMRASENLLGYGESAIGVIILLAGQVRLMLLAQDLDKRGVLSSRQQGFSYARAFDALPEHEKQHFPRTKEGKYPNAWRLYRVAQAASNFSPAELVRALDLLLQANTKLVSTQLDERLVIEELITRITLKPSRTG
jgi:DNA polymerase-3 subunit delta